MTRAPGWALIVAALRESPGATHRELSELTGLVGVTQRVDDARKRGYRIECRRVEDTAGRWFKRFYLIEAPVQRELGLAG